eukprot:888396-Rhodomonas_salina.3
MHCPRHSPRQHRTPPQPNRAQTGTSTSKAIVASRTDISFVMSRLFPPWQPQPRSQSRASHSSSVAGYGLCHSNPGPVAAVSTSAADMSLHPRPYEGVVGGAGTGACAPSAPGIAQHAREQRGSAERCLTPHGSTRYQYWVG